MSGPDGTHNDSHDGDRHSADPRQDDSRSADPRGSDPRSAAALAYDGESAPRLVAKGRGEVAEQIIALAEKHGVYLHEDPVLAQALQQLRLNQQIPRKLYIAIARVIAFAYYLQGRVPGQPRSDPG